MKTLGLWRQQATFQRRAFLSNSVSYYQCQPPFYLVKIPTTEALNTMGTNRITKIPTLKLLKAKAKSHILTGIPFVTTYFRGNFSRGNAWVQKWGLHRKSIFLSRAQVGVQIWEMGGKSLHGERAYFILGKEKRLTIFFAVFINSENEKNPSDNDNLACKHFKIHKSIWITLTIAIFICVN